MGVTTGELSDGESQTITITVPNTLTEAQASDLAAALNDAIAEFNAEQSTNGDPVLTVQS